MSKTREITSQDIAVTVYKVLHRKNSSKAAKSAAGSALSQPRTPKIVSLSKVASAASRTLRVNGSSKAIKSAAGSALTQQPNRLK